MQQIQPVGTTWQIRPEQPEDARLVEALGADGFGPGRFAKSAWRLREGVDPIAELGFVAVEQDTLRGSVRFWPVSVDSQAALLLGPLAVQSGQRGRGMGVGLMQAGIEAVRQSRGEKWGAIILVGDEAYYSRAGFARLPQGQIRFPGPVDQQRILGLSLQKGGLEKLSGLVRRARIDRPVCADGAPLA